MARVNPYLDAGCDVCLDMEAKSLTLLEGVQVKFLRRVLGLGRRSLKVVLFSETGVAMCSSLIERGLLLMRCMGPETGY
jgi:hypothetical protein